MAAKMARYFAGWADKNPGQTTEVRCRFGGQESNIKFSLPLQTNEAKFAYTRHEPIGVCVRIV